MLQKFLNFPIRTKIILGFTCVIFLVAIVIILFSINDNKTFAIKSAKKEIQGITKLVAETTGFGFQRLDFDYVLKSIEWLKKDPRIACIKIFDKDDNVLARYNNSSLPMDDPPSSISFEKPYLVGETLFYVSKILSHDAALQKSTYMGKALIGLSLKTLNQEIWANQSQSILFAVAVFLVGILLTLVLSNQITKPIVHLAGVSNQVAEKRNYELRASKANDDELGILVDQFNEMLAQIQKQDKALHDMNSELEKRVEIRTHDLKLAKETAEEASQAKSKFLSCMSHELKTPMNAMLGFGQLMKMDIEDPLSANHRLLINEILKAGKHLLNLINEILDLAQIESGMLSISTENIEVIEIIKEITSLMHPIATERNITITENFQPDQKIYILADHTRIRQIFLNLLSNAIKYNEENGSVTVSCNDEKMSFVTISFRDTGIGIDKEKARNIFRPFDRLGSENLSVEGSGIGLSITKTLIELMGGTIEFESSPSKGSCFSINIPKGHEPEQHSSSNDNLKTEVAPVLDAKYKLLYVDENLSSLNLLKHLLANRKDIQLLSAQQPKMSIELASAHCPDLIIWNIDYPGMDSHSIQELLQGNEVTRHIPSFAISNDGKVSSIENALNAGFVSYLIKPLDIPNFLNEINRILK